MRDSAGSALFHSRRSFSKISSLLEAELLSVLWAVECLGDLKERKVIFETTFKEAIEAIDKPEEWPRFRNLLTEINKGLARIIEWQIQEASEEGNKCASRIAKSVTEDHRYQSYVSKGGPRWLQNLWEEEANHVPLPRGLGSSR